MSSKKWILVKTFLLSIVTISTLNAQLCPSVNMNSYRYTGIGDGCSIGLANGLPDFITYKGVFTPACNYHDQCLVQLGSTPSICHRNFYGFMKNSCDDNYAWYNPKRALCREVAALYYDKVRQYQSEASYYQLQKGAIAESLKLKNNVEANQCATTPEMSNIYSTELISNVNSVFNTYAGRNPTLYEFLNVANSNNYLNQRDSWNSFLVNYAIRQANITPPPVSVVANTDFGLTLHAVQENGTSFLFKVNGISSSDSSLTLVNIAPMYNRNVIAQGFLRTTDVNGVSNILVINANYFLRGECSPRPGIACY